MAAGIGDGYGSDPAHGKIAYEKLRQYRYAHAVTYHAEGGEVVAHVEPYVGRMLHAAEHAADIIIPALRGHDEGFVGKLLRKEKIPLRKRAFVRHNGHQPVVA